MEQPNTSWRLRDLKRRLKQENPVLENVVDSFRELDRISRRLGFFGRDESHAHRTSWWPLISVLGVYSSGKSSFINHFLGYPLQATGNQAVDDKFTVICFTDDRTVRVLPGLALDADPRFPFFRVSRAIDDVHRGEGRRIDAYLQLKTCPSEALRGKILIDSPGFDADSQRNSTLRITDRIIDLSDLVLVFFDARHPESGSMHDTLEHLVHRTIVRPDSNKFLYVLNQIDATAAEDNVEDVFASWQRALAQSGLTAGSCYAVYIPELAAPIADPARRARYERKRDANLRAIQQRIDQVRVERAYRIVGILEQTAHLLAHEVVPRMEHSVAAWRRLTLLADAAVFGGGLALVLLLSLVAGWWDGLRLHIPFWEFLADYPTVKAVLLLLAAGGAGWAHFAIRRWAAGRVAARLARDPKVKEHWPNYARAFRKNTRWFRSIFRRRPVGWGETTAAALAHLADTSLQYVQTLNDQYTNPSGEAPRVPGTDTLPEGTSSLGAAVVTTGTRT